MNLQVVILLGVLAVLYPAVEACGLVKGPCQEKLLKKMYNLTTKCLTPKEYNNISCFAVDYMFNNRKKNISQIGNELVEYVAKNVMTLIPASVYPVAAPQVAICESCMRMCGSSTLGAAKKAIPALYKTLNPAYKDLQKKLNKMVTAGKLNKSQIVEEMFCNLRSYFCEKLFVMLMKPAKCLLSCKEWKCLIDTAKKLSELANYDRPEFQCGTCMAG